VVDGVLFCFSRTPLGLVVAGWGSRAMAAGPCTSERWTLLLLLVLSVVFAFCYEIAEDKEGYYVTATSLPIRGGVTVMISVPTKSWRVGHVNMTGRCSEVG